MKRCIITGANSGIGKAAAFQIAKQGVEVILACRNIKAANEVCEKIKSQTGNQNVHAMQVYLFLISNVKKLVKEYMDSYDTLDILINNAADFDLSRKAPKITVEGNEAQFATNHLAPFALTLSFLPLIEKSEDGRIINVASQGLMLYPNLTFDFENIKGQKKYSPAKQYYQTKLAQLMFSLLLKEKLTNTKISVYVVRVTNVKIDMNRYSNISFILKLMYKIKSKFSISPDEMAKVYTQLAIGGKHSGFYYDEKMQEVKANKSAYEKETQDKLWLLSEKLIK